MKKFIFLSIAMICMGFSCHFDEDENHHYTVKVTNNAEYPIYVFGDWGGDDLEPPYTWIYGYKGGNSQYRRANSGETNSEALASRPPTTIEGHLMANPRIHVYFIDATKYDNIPIGSPIPDDVIITARAYSLEDLRAIGFHIQYPLE